jgi:hypothetical protein
MNSLPSWIAISAARPQKPGDPTGDAATPFDQGANHFRIPERGGFSQRQKFPVGDDKRSECVGLRPAWDQKGFKAAGHLNVRLQSMECIGCAHGNDDYL